MSVGGPSGIAEEQSPYDKILQRAGKSHRLMSVQWEMTYRCNERCTHCYLDVLKPGAHVPDELTTAEAFRVVDELAELGALNLTLTGGEILVRRDWFDIAQYARSKKFLLRLFTNGILIKPTIADRIASLHPYIVEMSVYSTRPEVHDGITRIPRSHELTLRAAQLLIERGVRVALKTPLMHENWRELDQMKAQAERLGAIFRYDVTLTPKVSGDRTPLQHQMTDQDLIEFLRDTINAEFWVQRDLPPHTRTCSIGSFAMLIEPNGNVCSCVEVRQMVGNVRTQSLKEIWESASHWREYASITLNDLPICRTCELRNLCTRCHGLALSETGDMYAPGLLNCREALARRQVLIERGALPSDYPIPAHLRDYRASLAPRVETNFVPLTELTTRTRVPINAL